MGIFKLIEQAIVRSARVSSTFRSAIKAQSESRQERSHGAVSEGLLLQYLPTPESGSAGGRSMDFDGRALAEQLSNLHIDMFLEVCKRVGEGWANAWRYNSLTKILTIELGRLFYADVVDREDQIKAILLLANAGLVETLVLRTYIEHSCSRHQCHGLLVQWNEWVDLEDFRDLFDVLDRRLVRTVFVDRMSAGYLDDETLI